jgi:hypothetical protein
VGGKTARNVESIKDVRYHRWIRGTGAVGMTQRNKGKGRINRMTLLGATMD